MKNISLAKAILKGKCPQCRQGNIFPTSIFSFRKLTEVYAVCPNCNANMSKEPDFYYGAMYISYGFSVALVINVLIIIDYFFDDPDVWVYVWTVLIANLILVPVMLRYSKILYLYGLGKLKYNPEVKERNN